MMRVCPCGKPHYTKGLCKSCYYHLHEMVHSLQNEKGTRGMIMSDDEKIFVCTCKKGELLMHSLSCILEVADRSFKLGTQKERSKHKDKNLLSVNEQLKEDADYFAFWANEAFETINWVLPENQRLRSALEKIHEMTETADASRLMRMVAGKALEGKDDSIKGKPPTVKQMKEAIDGETK